MQWSLIKAATEFNCSRETLRRGLISIDVEVKPHNTYSTKQIFRALSGDLKFERTRRERAEADKAEIEASLAQKSVHKTEDVTVFIRNTFAPVREFLMGLPGLYAARANPANPAVAKIALLEAVDQCLKQCKEHLPEAKSK